MNPVAEITSRQSRPIRSIMMSGLTKMSLAWKKKKIRFDHKFFFSGGTLEAI
jgi:hypothetical protein